MDNVYVLWYLFCGSMIMYMQKYSSLFFRWLFSRKCPIGIFAFILLSGAIFYVIIPRLARAETLSPVSEAKDIVVAEDSGNVFILNGDGTISIYDPKNNVFILARAPLSGTEGLEIVSLVASRSGKYVVALAVDAITIRAVLYDIELLSGSAQLRNVNFYDLPRSGRGSLVLGKFSYDEANFYVADGPAGNLFVLSVATTNTDAITVYISGIITGIETSMGGDQLFLLTQNPDQLVIVNKRDYSVIRRYDLESAPTDLLYNNTLKRVFVSKRGNDTVTALDLKTGGIRELRVGALPVSLTYDKGNGNVFVANSGDGSINVILPDNTTKKMDLGLSAYANYPIFLWYSNQAKTLIALNLSARRLYFIDPAQLRVVKEEVVGGWARAFHGGDNESHAAIYLARANNFLLVNAETQKIVSVPSQSENKLDLALSSPNGVVVHRASGRVFVSNLGVGDITVLDGGNFTVIAKIPTGPSPQVLALNQVTNKLYVTDPVENTVTAVDLSQDAYPSKVIPVGQMPRSSYINTVTNKIYVSLSGENRIAVLDGATDLLETTIDLGSRKGFPLLISINEKKNEIYVADYSANFVSVIDGTTNKVIKTIKVGQKPIWVSYYPELNNIYVTVEGDKKVVIINPETHEIVKEFILNAVPYRLFLDKATNFVYVIHRAEKRVSIFKNDGVEIEFLTEREIPFLGQLDTTYNMIYADIGQFAKDTRKIFITSQPLNNLSILELARDVEGIMGFNLLATVNSAGEVFYTQTGETTGTSLLSVRNAVLAIFLVVLVILFVIYRKRRGAIV